MSDAFGKFDMLTGKHEPNEVHRRKKAAEYMRKCRAAMHIEHHGLLNLNQGQLNFGKPGDLTEHW